MANPTIDQTAQPKGIRLSLNQLVLLTLGSVVATTLIVYAVTKSINK
jgi:hypothetical protein